MANTVTDRILYANSSSNVDVNIKIGKNLSRKCKKSLKTKKKIKIFKKSLKKVLTINLRCGILTMQSPRNGVAKNNLS